jgi:hypothetical protein
VSTNKPTFAKLSGVFLLSAFFFVTQNLRAACGEVKARSALGLVQYLSRDRALLSDNCIELAIDQLRDLKDPAAIDVLVRYLDFRRPPTPSELNGASYRMDRDSPAVSALFSIGVQSLPAIERAIQNEDLSERESKNAVNALMLFHRERPAEGVAFLREAYLAAPSLGLRDRLIKDVNQAVQMCGSTWHSRCMGAAAGLVTESARR